MKAEELIEELYKRSLTWESVTPPHDLYVSYEERVYAVSKDSVGCFYGRAACVASLSIRKMNHQSDDYTVSLIFNSIDDGCVPLLGPTESLEKAKRRIEVLKDKLSKIGTFIPTYDQAEKLCRECGMYLNL